MHSPGTTKGDCLVYFSCHNKLPPTGGPRSSRNVWLAALEAGCSRSCQGGWVWHRPSCRVRQLLSCCSHLAEGEREFPRVSPIWALTHPGSSILMIQSPPRGPPPYAITLGIRISMGEFERAVTWFTIRDFVDLNMVGISIWDFPELEWALHLEVGVLVRHGKGEGTEEKVTWGLRERLQWCLTVSTCKSCWVEEKDIMPGTLGSESIWVGRGWALVPP